MRLPEIGSIWVHKSSPYDKAYYMPRSLRVEDTYKTIAIELNDMKTPSEHMVKAVGWDFVLKVEVLHQCYEEVTDPDDIGFFLLQEMP